MSTRSLIMQIIFIAYSVLVIYLTLMPSDGPDIGNIDKLFHFGMYFVMALLALLAFRSKRGRLIALVFTFGIGLVLEWSQGFIEQRSPSLADSLANILGACLGILAYLAWQWVMKKSRKEDISGL